MMLPPRVLALADRGISLDHCRPSGRRSDQGGRCGTARGLVLFNAGAIDDRLREEDCRANVIHTAPTRSMLADGLAQYLVWKQWRRWLSGRRFARPRQALCRRAAQGGAQVRSADRAGAGVRGYRRRAAHRQRRGAGAAADTECSRRRRPPTTCWSPPTRARCLPPICRIGPGMRGRWQARPDLSRPVGTDPTTCGAPFRCRTGS